MVLIRVYFSHRQHFIKKIFIFDFDAHHGNGTQEIFYHTNKVFYSSIHTLDFYPKTGLESEIGLADGMGCNLNVIVPRNIDVISYLYFFENKILAQIDNYKPDLILVSAGFDGLLTDPMKIMNLTPECYGMIVKKLVFFGIPVCLILEGGYNLQDLPICFDICLKELASNYY